MCELSAEEVCPRSFTPGSLQRCYLRVGVLQEDAPGKVRWGIEITLWPIEPQDSLGSGSVLFPLPSLYYLVLTALRGRGKLASLRYELATVPVREPLRP
jgi:hypothetical protein